jgi:ADP-ribosyl-[dinitrogen reductase] hydrolase
MSRTSLTHPLQIASVTVGEGMGRVGITFCPGKVQPQAFSGSWRRDLGIDLDAIRAWGACTVISLIEPHEIEQLGVGSLREAVESRGMRWFHLPIPDVSVPDGFFETDWITSGAAIRKTIRSGHDVVVHCKGGLGRAGTIAARLLVELGWKPERAIRAVRDVRPGAIESEAQRRHVLQIEEMRDDAS